MSDVVSCPKLVDLERFLLGRLEEVEAQRTEQHVAGCRNCLDTLHDLKADDTLIDAVRAQGRAVQRSEDVIVDGLIAHLSALDPPAAHSAATPISQSAGDSVGGSRAPPPLVAGYEMLGVLGQGGMGVVYRARHKALKRIVAVKMISVGNRARPDYLARFRTEVESVARLQHPHVVQIHEVGETDGQPYCALEYVSGGSLAQKLGGTPLPPEQAVAIVKTLAETMHVAHKVGVIHRDLKPANVLLTEDGMPKITDFGLARNLDQAGQTQAGLIMGTPSYMAPEQAQGGVEAVGPAADIYALGAILYECLTGRPPFRAATTLDTLQQVIRDTPVPPRQLQSKTPRDLETICLKCLYKEPAKRYVGALDLALDLRRWQQHEPILARPTGLLERGLQWCRRNRSAAAWMAVSIVCLLAGSAVSTYYAIANHYLAELAGRKQREAEGNFKVASLRERESNWHDYAAQLQLMGRSWEDGNFGHLEQLMEQAESREGIRAFRGWEWSYLRDQCRQAGRELKGTASYSGEAVWCRQTGRIAAATGTGAIDLWDSLGETVVCTLPAPAQNSKVIRLAWSPDGQRLASCYKQGVLLIWEALSGKLCHTLPGRTYLDQALAWSHDGTRLASAGYDGLINLWDPSDGRLVRTLTGNKGTMVSNVAALAWHPDGIRLAAGHRGQRAIIWNTATAETLVVSGRSSSGASAYAVDWSPDGKWLAAGFVSDIMIVDEQGNELTTLSGHTRTVRSVQWSPDGTRLASGSADQTVRVWNWNAGKPVPLATQRLHAMQVINVAWSPTGDRLLSGANGLRGMVGNVRIAAVVESVPQVTTLPIWETRHPSANLSDSSKALQDRPLLSALAWSPDGQQLAVVGANRVAEIRNVRTGDVVHHLVFPGNPNTVYHSVSWSPDGQRVAVGDWGVGNVSVFEASTGELTHTLFERPKGGNQIVAWSPDGRWLATANGYFDTIVWDTSSWQAIEPLNDKNPFDALAWSPDGTRLAMGMVGNDLSIWEVASRQNILSALPFGVRRMDWSPDGRLLAVATGQPILVDVSDGKLVCRLTNHTSGVSEVRWSPDGRRIATGGGDGVRIYDAATADLLLAMPCGKVAVTGLAWSPDGRRLAGACSDGLVRLWGSADIESMPRAAVLETGVLARVGQ